MLMTSSFLKYCRQFFYELQVFASIESTISVTGTSIVDFREYTIDLTEINTLIEDEDIDVSIVLPTYNVLI